MNTHIVTNSQMTNECPKKATPSRQTVETVLVSNHVQHRHPSRGIGTVQGGLIRLVRLIRLIRTFSKSPAAHMNGPNSLRKNSMP